MKFAAEPHGTARAFFASLPSDAEGLDVQGVCQFSLDGQGGGQFYLRHDGGKLTLGEGIHPEPDAQVEGEARCFLEVVAQRRYWRGAIASGDLRVEGDPELFAALFFNLLCEPVYKELFDRMEAKAASEPPLTRLERLPYPSEGEAAALVARRRPFVLTGALGDDALERWTFEGLAERHGDAAVMVGFEVVPLREFAAEVSASREAGGPVPYASGTALPAELGALLEPPPYFPPACFPRELLSVWMGAAGWVTRLHRDAADGFLLQACGTKHFYLFSPDQAPCLYPVPRFELFQSARVDPERVDLARFPRYADARPVEFTLSAGEMLYLPGGWFHQVRTLEPAISVKWFVMPEGFPGAKG